MSRSVTLFFFLAIEVKWWLCSVKYFRPDKAVLERVCDKEELSDWKVDGIWQMDCINIVLFYSLLPL